MTPPERPEVEALTPEEARYWDFGAAIRESIVTGQETPGQMAERMLRNPLVMKYLAAAAAEPLRGALEQFANAQIDHAIERMDDATGVAYLDEDTAGDPVGNLTDDDFRDIYGALKAARAALEATAPSTPEPALDVERLRRSIDDALSAMDDEWLVDELAEEIAREYLTSEPRAAVPQEGDEG